MPLDPGRLTSRAPALALVAVGLAALVGCWAFFVSMRPCKVRLAPGTLVNYSLRTDYAEIRGDGTLSEARTTESDVALVCIGEGNEVALIAPGRSDTGGRQRDEVTILNLSPDGSARRVGDDGVADEGKALGFFDFNLLPLPPGNEQDWKVSLVYAALPPDKRQVVGRVKRTSNSSRPEFELRLPTIEWVNDQHRYLQVKNLTCTYRFDTSKGLVEKAQVRCDTGIERDDGTHCFRVTVSLDLLAMHATRGDTVALRDLALATADTQRELAGEHRERLEPLLRRIRESTVDHPELRAVAERLSREALDPSPIPVPGPPARRLPVHAPAPLAPVAREPLAPGPTGGWAVQVSAVPLGKRAQADRLAAKLVAQGLPASVSTTRTLAVVRIGPLAQRDDRVLAAVCAQQRGAKPYWIKLK